jgi:hypothetical protein
MEPFCPERSGGTDANRARHVRKPAVRPSFFKKFLKSWLGAESSQLFSVALSEAVPKTSVFGETGFACPATYKNGKSLAPVQVTRSFKPSLLCAAVKKGG